MSPRIYFRSDPVPRFWAKVQKSDGCWQWTGATKQGGYGRFWDGERVVMATHMSWRIHRGLVPNGLFLCHTCDNPPCVNPDHLFLGTLTDNVRDMVAKGRHGSPGWSSQRTHCKRGHRLTPENCYQVVRDGVLVGKRCCRTCYRAAVRAWREREKLRRTA